MNAEQNSPAFWRSLYEPPGDSTTAPAADSSRSDFDAADLVAEIDLIALEAAEETGGSGEAIDTEALAALVEDLVKARLEALGANPVAFQAAAQSGGHVAPSPAAAPPPRRAEVPSPGPIPQVSEPAPPRAETPSPPRRRPPAPRPAPQAGGEADPFASAVSSADQAPAVQEPVAPEPPKAAAPPPPPKPAPPKARPSTPKIDKTQGHWVKVPVLKGGMAALMTAGLDPGAGLVLSMVDGVHTMKGIKALLAHVPDEEFLQIFRDALGKGLLEFQ